MTRWRCSGLQPELARILAWLVGAKMMTLVVKSGAFANDAVQRLRSLANQRGPLCHFLALDLISACPYADAAAPDTAAGTDRGNPVDSFRARWVTLRARWVTMRARWVTRRARWVTRRARWVTRRARWVTLRARWVR
jgi:hypothetical protein